MTTTITLQEALGYSLSGFAVVMITLAILWILTLTIGQIVKTVGLDKVNTPETKPATGGAIDPHTIAVITAAVSFATSGKAKIKDIQRKN